MMDSPKSVDKIEPFVEEYNVDLSIAQKHEFRSFNDFFVRKLKPESRPVNGDSNVVVSPADGKVLAYDNISEKNFIVKGYRFNIREFLKNDSLAKKYEDGALMLFRLCPVDYHRFHFPVSGGVSHVSQIDGNYYSVNPIAIKEIVEVFCENKREYLLISTLNFGNVIMAEVGATMVGSIVQTYQGDLAVKGEEKGFFKFGGSSVVLLFEKGRVKIDNDLLINTENNLETEIRVGERIGLSATSVSVLSSFPEYKVQTILH
jgi:phosphatidylserine decarboxylase